MQQTPNPLAHDPDSDPPRAPHSAEVKQVPFLSPPSHGELLNRMISNGETIRRMGGGEIREPPRSRGKHKLTYLSHPLRPRPRPRPRPRFRPRLRRRPVATDCCHQRQQQSPQHGRLRDGLLGGGGKKSFFQDCTVHVQEK